MRKVIRHLASAPSFSRGNLTQPRPLEEMARILDLPAAAVLPFSRSPQLRPQTVVFANRVETGRDSRVIRNSKNVRPRVVRSGSRQLRQFCLRLPVLFGWHGASFKGVGAARIPTGRPVIRRSLALSVPFQSGSAHAAASGLGPRDTRENSGESLPIHSIWASWHARRIFAGPKSIPCDLSPQVLQ